MLGTVVVGAYSLVLKVVPSSGSLVSRVPWAAQP